MQLKQPEECMWEMLTLPKMSHMLRSMKTKNGVLMEQNPNKNSQFAEFYRNHPDILMAWLIPSDSTIMWRLYVLHNDAVSEIEGTNVEKLGRLQELIDGLLKPKEAI